VPPVAAPVVGRVRGLFAAWGQPGPLRLSLTFAMLVLIGFGMSNVYPEWYARQHGMDAGRASNILAIFNLAMVPAGFLTGAMLARGWRDSRLLSGLLVLTAVVALPLFKPGVGEIARLTALLAWMLVQGALIAVVIAALPRVVADPRHGAAAAGLLSQLAALVTLVTPPIWQPILHGGWWQGFIAVTAAAALLAWLLFPRRSA
jgi:cyanate permease